MRHLLARVAPAVLALCAASPAAAAEDPARVRRLVEAGAVEVALTRIEALQPGDVIAASWVEWEALRCEVLARLDRRGELRARVDRLPRALGPATLNGCLLEAARAAFRDDDPLQARDYAARLLWQRTATPAQTKAVRLTVIETYLAERRGEDAFRSMLRFQQDYAPLEPAVVHRFAEALLDLNQEREALNWLARSEELSPIRLRLELRNSMLSAEALIKQARLALARNPDPGYWRALFDAGVRTRNPSIQIEALERLVQLADAHNMAAQAQAAQRLWQAYADLGGDIGNREQFLTGDDGAWADYASRRVASDAFASRAIFGLLAQRGQNAEIRRSAQLQLAHSLASSGLDLTALRLLGRMGFEIEGLDAQTRHLLGTAAAKRNESALALRLWEGLPAPASANAIEWQLTLVRTTLHAGEADASAVSMQRLLSGRSAVSAELAQATLEIAQEMLDLRKLDAAETVYTSAIPVMSEARAREALFGLGRVHELKGDMVAAAGSYLAAALSPQGAVPDALAFQARLLSALSLMRAGLKSDARAQFEWILKNSREPALTEAARRGLNRL